MLKKEVTSLRISIIRVCWTTLNIFPHWISKPRIWKHKNHSKASSGTGRFAQNLRACKKSWYNVRNCKSGRHNWRHTFRRRNSRHRCTSTNIPYNGLKVKERKNGKTKNPSPCRGNRMLRAVNLCHNTSLCGSPKFKLTFLPLGGLNLCNDYISMDPEYSDHFCFLNQVDWNINLLDNMLLTKVVVQPTNKPRIVGPHKLKSEKTMNKKKSRLKQEIQEYEHTTTCRT